MKIAVHLVLEGQKREGKREGGRASKEKGRGKREIQRVG